MNVQEELTKAIENFKSIELAKNHLEKLNDRLGNAHFHLEHLRHVLKKEYEDVKALEDMNINNLFRKILGNVETQLEKERQEYLQAALKYNEFLKTVELMEFEQQLLEKKVAGFNKAKSHLHALIRQREKELIHTNSDSRLLIQNINSEMDAKLNMKREINEALTVGLKVTEILRQMEDHLEKATDWGQWTSSYNPPGEKYIKHVDKANKLSFEAKSLLLLFEDELKDIYEDQKLYLAYNLESFKHFNSFFYDNLISDWILQKKIKNALSFIQACKDKVIRICSSLKQEFKQTSSAIEYLQNKKEQIVLDVNDK